MVVFDHNALTLPHENVPAEDTFIPLLNVLYSIVHQEHPAVSSRLANPTDHAGSSGLADSSRLASTSQQVNFDFTFVFHNSFCMLVR